MYQGVTIEQNYRNGVRPLIDVKSINLLQGIHSDLFLPKTVPNGPRYTTAFVSLIRYQPACSFHLRPRAAQSHFDNGFTGGLRDPATDGRSTLAPDAVVHPRLLIGKVGYRLCPGIRLRLLSLTRGTRTPATLPGFPLAAPTPCFEPMATLVQPLLPFRKTAGMCGSGSPCR